MKYTQQKQKSHVSVLTDAPINLSSDTIVEMMYDRESDSFVPSRPSRIVYPAVGASPLLASATAPRKGNWLNNIAENMRKD